MLPVLIAYLAPIISVVQQIPQLHKIYMTQKVRDLSFGSLLLFLFSSIIWLSHGYFIKDLTLIIGGVLGVSINLLVIGLYLLYR